MPKKNPCNSCGSKCADDCKCNEPDYSPLGCKEPIPFKCVQLLEKNPNNSPISYPCIPFSTDESLFTLTERIAAWKCEYDNLITKVKVSQYDTQASYLSNKIVSGDCISFEIVSPGANEKLRPIIDWSCVLTKLTALPGFCTAVSGCGPSLVCAASTNFSVS